MLLRGIIAVLVSLCVAAPAAADRVSAIEPPRERRLMHPEQPEEPHGMAQFCGAPRPARGQQVVLVGVHEGDGMSTVAVGGQDVETTVVYVDIEPGTEPLYIVLTSHSSMIWIFRGATQRVSHATLMTRSVNNQTPAVGAVGLRRDRVSVHPACYQSFSSINDRQAHVIRDAMTRTLGRPVDHVAGVYSAAAIALPSGQVTETRPHPN